MEMKQTNSGLEGLNGVEENFEGMSKAGSSCSDTSFDFCWDVDNVEKNMFAENLGEPKSEGSLSDFDLCDEFGRVDVSSVPESIKSSKDVPTGTNSESESVDIKSNYSDDSIRSMGIEVFCNEVTTLPRKRKYMMEAEMTFPVPDTLYHEDMTNQEFKKMRLRDIVQEHALPFLPAKSLARFRSVSKAWERWIKSPFLAHKQSYTFQNTSGYFHERCDGTITCVSLSKPAYGVQNSFFNSRPRNLSIMSSCNGLLLCRTRDENIYYVCNPATNEWKELPRPSYYHGEDPSVVLAFEPSILNMEANYHLVCAFQLLGEPVLCFEIYSSKTETWKCVDPLCAELGDAILQKTGFYYNGVAYWETTTNEVLAFDLKTELHGVLPFLDGLPARGALSQMNKELSYVCARETNIGGIFEVSVYLVGVGGIMELKKCVCFELGSVSVHNSCLVLPGLTDDMVMLLVDGRIYACNLISKKAEAVMTSVNLDNEAVFFPYVNSLVSVA